MRLLVSRDTDRIVVKEPRPAAEPPYETHESRALFNQAIEYLNRNRHREAMKSLEDALRISPRNPEYLSHYGVAVACELEDYEAAEKLCERAVRLDPRDPVYRVNLGRVYRMNGRNGAAYEEFLAAWESDRRHPAPAAELSRMGIRRPPVIRFLPRSNWLNVQLGRLRARLSRNGV